MRKIGLLVLFILIALVTNYPDSYDSSSNVAYVFTFDQDGDGIDDGIDLDGQYPIWGLVHTDEEITINTLRKSISSIGCSVGTSLSSIPVTIVSFPDEGSMISVSQLPYVNVIEADGIVTFAMDTSVKSVKAASSSIYSPSTVRDLGYTGEGMTVAVLDLGIDNEHPLLEGSFVAGVDFTVPASPLTPRDGTYDPDDLVGHGTGVACVLASRGDADGNFEGIAPEAGILDLKMSDYNPAYIRAMAEAMDWCLQNSDTDWGDGHQGIDVISMSALTGLDPDGTISGLIDLIADEGIPFIQAAGNDGVQHGEDPASYFWSDNVITAGGLDDKGTVERDDDTYWSGATYGPRIDDGDGDPYDELRPDIVAPALELSVAAHSGDTTPPSGRHTVEGTSYATPHVSGVVALILQANPDIGSLEGRDVLETIRTILHETAEARGAPYDPSLSLKYNTRYGYGILDGYEAVQRAIALMEGNSQPEIVSLKLYPEIVAPGGQTMIYVEASDPDGDELRYDIEIEDGTLEGERPAWAWKVPDVEGDFKLRITVTDSFGDSAEESGVVQVYNYGNDNDPPVIESFSSSKRSAELEEVLTLVVEAFDPDGDRLDYEYDASSGRIIGSGSEIDFKVPDELGEVTVEVTVSDGKGGEDFDMISIEVIAPLPPDPPVIDSYSISPVRIEGGDPSIQVLIEVSVLEGSDPIEGVYADLSELEKSSRVPLSYMGTVKQDESSYLDYSLEMRGFQRLDPGTYIIDVIAEDEYGRESEIKELTLEVIYPEETDPEVELVSGGFPTWIIGLMAVVLFTSILISIFIRKLKL